MLDNNSAYKYETTYMGIFVTKNCWTNGTVTLQCVTSKIRYNIRRIKPHKSHTKIEDNKIEDMSDISQRMIAKHIQSFLH